jgi:hypothetical protein
MESSACGSAILMPFVLDSSSRLQARRDTHRRLRHEGKGMNVGRGLFRAWIVISLLWIAGTVAMAISMVPGTLANWKYQYEGAMRPGIDLLKADWTRPYYELMKSPSKEGLKPSFAEEERLRQVISAYDPGRRRLIYPVLG